MNMSNKPPPVPPVFHIDVAGESSPGAAAGAENSSGGNLIAVLLQRLLEGQDRQNELLEQISSGLILAQKQKSRELADWQEMYPGLALQCRKATGALSRVQANLLESIAAEVVESEEMLQESEFALTEFVDRFGARLAHLNNVIQVMAQLGGKTPR